VAAYVTWSTHTRLLHYSRALAHERQHDFVGARTHYLKALNAGMRSASLFNELAWVQSEAGIGDPQQAVDFAWRALEMAPDNADYLDTYGWALYKAGRYQEALEPLRKAYRKKPDMYCIHYHLGAVYLALARRAEAYEHLKQQVALPHVREGRMAARALAQLGADSQ